MSNTIPKDRLEKIIFKYFNKIFENIEIIEPDVDDDGRIWIDSSRRYFLYITKDKILFIDGPFIAEVKSIFNLENNEQTKNFIKKWLGTKIKLRNFRAM